MRRIRLQQCFLGLLGKRTLAMGATNSNSDRLVEVVDSPVKGVKIISMRSPASNVLSTSLMSDILDSIGELCNPDKTHCHSIVMTSSVTGAFSTGLDFQELYQGLEYDTFANYWSMVQKLFITLNTLPVPLVAAINGDASGLGCVMALASDYRIMAEKIKGRRKPPKIGIDVTRHGLTLPPCFVAVVAHVVGHRACETLFQLGELADAPTAKMIGLVDETVEYEDEVLLPSLDVAERLSCGAPWSYWIVKETSRKKIVAPLCTPALRAADCFNFYEFLNNPDVRRDLGDYVAGNN